MNQKYLFLSVDSYAHIKRNIFGFKNRKGVTEQRPCSLAVIASVDSVMDTMRTASFKGAKIKDDPDYKMRPVDPAYYGHPKSESEIYELLNIMTRSVRETVYVVQDSSREVFRNFVSKNESALGNLNEKTVGFYSFMVDQVSKIPTTYFVMAMETGSIEGYYNMNVRQISGSEEIDSAVKFELIQTHVRYPKFLDSDRALATAIKMNEAYTLVCSIVNKYK
jgi:hypothetical protein